MTRTIIPLACLALLIAAPASARADENARRLLDRADQAYRSDTAAAVMTMEIHKRAYDRSYKIVSWDRRGEPERALIKILGPASWRGFATLKIGQRLELYDPKTNHVTVVGSSMLGDDWMGSHFSNDDLVHETRLAHDFEVRELGSKQTESEIGPATLHRLELRPKPRAPVAWGRIVYELLETKDTVVPRRAQYFRKPRDTKPERTMTFDEIEKLGGRLVPSRLTVTVADAPGEYTRLVYDRLELDIDIPAAKFTEQAMRK